MLPAGEGSVCLLCVVAVEEAVWMGGHLSGVPSRHSATVHTEGHPCCPPRGPPLLSTLRATPAVHPEGHPCCPPRGSPLLSTPRATLTVHPEGHPYCPPRGSPLLSTPRATLTVHPEGHPCCPPRGPPLLSTPRAAPAVHPEGRPCCPPRGSPLLSTCLCRLSCYFRPTLLSVVTVPPPRTPPPPKTSTRSGLCSCDPDRDQREASWPRPVSPSARALGSSGNPSLDPTESTGSPCGCVGSVASRPHVAPCALGPATRSPLAPSVPGALGPGGQTGLRPSVQPPLLPPGGGDSHPRSGSSEAGASSPFPRVPQPGPRAPGAWICYRVSPGPPPHPTPPATRPPCTRPRHSLSCRLRARQPRGRRAGPCVCPGPGRSVQPQLLPSWARGPSASSISMLPR
uniref:Uncharacterized protein n=1 Tax=Myotis myotis TaxID=51298 RepID=A0A7J7ZWF2_MYOMY|nr:hypothetical protein mMyoMyo1_009564 [Myotis myotis]